MVQGSASLLPRSAGADGDGVDALAGDVAQRGVDQTLALKPRNALELRRFYHDGEVRFAAAVIAHVTRMRGGVVDDLEVSGSKGCGEQRVHFLS